MRSKISVLLLFTVLLAFSSGCHSDTVSSGAASYEVVDALNTKLFAIDEPSLYETINQKLESDGLSLLPLDGYDFMLLSENGKSGKLAIYSFSQDEADKAVSIGNTAAAGWVGYVKSIELSTYASDADAAKRNGIYIRAIISVFSPGSEEFVENALGIYGTPSGDAKGIESGLEITVDTVTYKYFPDNVSFQVSPSEESVPNAIRPN